MGSNWNEDIKDYERIVSGYFKGTIYQQFLPMDRSDVSQISILDSTLIRCQIIQI